MNQKNKENTPDTQIESANPQTKGKVFQTVELRLAALLAVIVVLAVAGNHKDYWVAAGVCAVLLGIRLLMRVTKE